MTAWHLAPALVAFRAQLNAAFPNRDTRSDGTIGDLRHQHEAGGSDHNPDSTGTVCAFDGTHGPYWHVTLADANLIANQLVASGDPRINYVIFNRRIWTKAKGWHDYPVPPNASPHLEHFHLSVFHGALANDDARWNLPAFGLNAPALPVISAADLVAAHVASITQSITNVTDNPEQDEDDMAQFFRNTQTGAMIRAGVTSYTLLTPPQAQLETEFGAKFADLDPTTFAEIIGSRDQAGINSVRL